jgi:hypothetical protein
MVCFLTIPINANAKAWQNNKRRFINDGYDDKHTNGEVQPG